MSKILYTSDGDFSDTFLALLSGKDELSAQVIRTVEDILHNIRTRGDAALFEYIQRFDNIALRADTVRFSDAEIAHALQACDADIVRALKHAKQRIEDFHIKTLPAPVRYTDAVGVHLEMRYTPVARAGLYVPGGTASYPSSVLMNAVPAQVAGVANIVIAVPTPNGHINPYVLAAAHIAGVSEIYKIGGAQAIGALAYGTESIPKVSQITGPGNAFVAAAKRSVYGTVGIDMMAGPSEVLIVADKTANPEWVACDVLAQAEHDTAAQSIVITDDSGLADKIIRHINRILPTLPRHNIAKASWDTHGAIICVDSIQDALPLVDAIAPEHLQICVHNAEQYSKQVKNAAAIFLGNHAPTAIGDYIGGTNHVLPTARSAHFASGLGVLDFMKRTTVLGCPHHSLQQIAPDAIKLAQTEGLDAHALSLAKRLEK